MDVPDLNNTSLREYINLLIGVKLAAIRGDDEEANRLRDASEDIGDQLTYDQVRWLYGLSGDLDAISNDEVFLQPTMPAHECHRLIAEAVLKNDPSLVLNLLRQAGQLSKEYLSYFRARAYDTLGFTEVAVLFMRHAYEVSGRDRYACPALEMLVRLQRWHDVLSFSDAALGSSQPSQSLVIYAAGAIVSACRILDDDTRLSRMSAAINYLEPMIRSDRVVQISDITLIEYSFACKVLAFCYEQTMRFEDAVDVYDILLSINPNDSDCLVGRGNARIDFNQIEEADRDYLKAVELHTRFSTPYLILARDAILRHEFDSCRVFLSKMLDETSEYLNARARATAYDFLATCAYASNAPAVEVQRYFDLALNSDPDNRRIQHNREAILNAMLAGLLDSPGELPESSDIRELDAPNVFMSFDSALKRVSEVTDSAGDARLLV
jgi:tetratricopeptide (TPR) repeat protein